MRYIKKKFQGSHVTTLINSWWRPCFTAIPSSLTHWRTKSSKRERERESWNKKIIIKKKKKKKKRILAWRGKLLANCSSLSILYYFGETKSISSSLFKFLYCLKSEQFILHFAYLLLQIHFPTNSLSFSLSYLNIIYSFFL